MQNGPGGALFRVGAAPAAAVGAAICRPGDSAMGMAGPFHPPFSFCTAAKRERAVDGPREKTPRRVGLRRRRPPAAGGGWLAVPCRSQGRKRPALGETSGPGKSGIHPAPLFAAAGRWLMRVAAWANATTSTPARAARSEAERAEREAGQMRPCTPTRSAPSTTGQQLGEPQKTQACLKAGQNRRLHRYADPRRARRATAPERA